MSALQTDGLGKRYGSKWALRECTLEVPEGTVTALVGPNGAGAGRRLRRLLRLAVYHPAGHFWPLQLIETAIFGGAALALIGFAVWWTLRRMA
jgi:ABC-type phosphate/phosphonate transport system ATPase subunit